jgi:hypothetical protein
MVISVIGFVVPLTLSDGVRGFAWGMGAATGVLILMRCYFLARLFPGFGVFTHAARSMWPTVPAVAAVLLIRSSESGPRSAAQAAFEAVVFMLVLGIGVFFGERNLVREVLGYLRRGAVSRSAA